MREGLAGLTTRGRLFLAAGGGAAVAALVLGEKDLIRVAVLLAVLPLLSAWYIGRARYRLACQRSLEPRRAQVGASARVVLRLENISRLPAGTILLEDRLPYALGSRPRLVLERLRARQASTVAYSVRADVRGCYEVGPLTARMRDPFGLCELTRSFSTKDRLTVIPQITPLDPVRLTAEYAGSGESRTRSVAVHGDDDVATREYRHGDDLRRVHWRSTARVGELMVRCEELPWESRATVILDTRAAAHRGEGPASSFEWAVSAAASIALHLRPGGYRLRLITEPGSVVDASEIHGEDALLDHLAGVGLSATADIAGLVEGARNTGDGGLTIGVFGALSAAEADQVAAARGRGGICIALLIDSSTWLALPPPERAEADLRHETSALTLVHNGWRVVGVPHGGRLAALWPQAGRDQQGFAWRAASAEIVAGGHRS